MSVFIAMCQVNIALGILYLGLPESRYREKLIEIVIARLSENGYNELDVQSSHYQKLMIKESTFSKYHHFIQDWFGEIPTTKLDDKWRNINVKEQNKMQWFNWFKRSPTYFWYRYGLDKKLTLIILVILPILGVWLSEFYSTFEKLAKHLWISGLVLGQIIVIIHVIIGRTMATSIGRKITKRIQFMSRKLYELSADSQADEVNRLRTP